MTRSQRALVSLPAGAWQFVRSLKGKLGNNNSEIIRNIVISYSTQNHDQATAQSLNDATEERVDQIIAATNHNNDMMLAQLRALLNLLSEKKLIDLFEWEKKYRGEMRAAQTGSTELRDNGSSQPKS